jgi:Kdo2-lipid IVA lauroyltransferase/acyltransferase
MKRFRYWLEWFLLSFFSPLIPMLPLPLLRRLADLAGAVMYRFDSRSRTVALVNLEVAFGSELDPGQRKQIARRSIQVFARSFLELFWTRRLTAQNVEQFITFEDPGMFQEMLDSETPVIGITPHFGNFEWGSALFAFRGYAGIILTQRFKNDRLTDFFRQLREISGQIAVTQENSMLRLFRALRRGVPVGILTDLTLKLRDPAVIIDSFGMKKRVTLLHGMLHEGTRSPILPFITLSTENGGYKVRILPKLYFPEGTPYHEIAQVCWNQFEPIIRENKEHWLWMYKHWRYRPEQSERDYPMYANKSSQFDREIAAQTQEKESLRKSHRPRRS